MKTFLCKHKELVFQTSIRNPLIEKLFFSGNYKKLSLFINSFFDKREKFFLCKHKELVFQTSIRNPLIEKLFFSGNYKKLSLFINSFFDKREKFFLESIRFFFSSVSRLFV